MKLMVRKNPLSGASAILIIIILALVGVGVYLLVSQKIISFNFLKLPNSSSNNQAFPSVTPTPTEAPDLIPQEDKLYLGMANGVEAIFFTNSTAQVYYENGIKKTSQYIGQAFSIEGTGYQPFDYKNFSDPKRLKINLAGPIQNINTFKYNGTKTILYVSLNIASIPNSPYPDNLVNEIYQVKLDTLTGTLVWSNKLGSEKYPVRGAAYINQVADDKYLLLLLGECYACGGHQFTKTLFVNLTTKAEKYSEGIGGIKFDLPSSSFTYQKLVEVQVPCGEEGPYCTNGFYSEMQPSGPTYVDKLP